MPLNKSTTYHQSVQFFVHFFSIFKKIFLLSFTSNLLNFTTFYSVLPRLVLSFTKYPTSGACMRVLLFCDRTLGAATYPSVMMAMSVRRHTKVLAIGEG